jgi:hypothetical protein
MSKAEPTKTPCSTISKHELNWQKKISHVQISVIIAMSQVFFNHLFFSIH